MGSKTVCAKVADRKQGLNRSAELRSYFETEIGEGRLMPGDAIAEQEVADRFGVSRTPVREALLQLGSLGLVSFRPRRGAVVSRVPTAQIVGMREVLTEMEAFCAQLSARRMTTEERHKLSLILDENRLLANDNATAAYLECNFRFHEALYAGAKNPYLARQVSEIRTRLHPYTGAQFSRPGGLERSHQGHRQIVDAVLAGDDIGAATAMRDHIMSGAQSFQDLIANLTSQASEG